MDIVKVKCLDMTHSTGIWPRKEIATFGLIELEIVGWLVEDKPDCLIISPEYQPEDDEFRYLQAIPKVCIKEVTKLGLGKPSPYGELDSQKKLNFDVRR